jgi:threonine/homoserine/homoserine lactone efflux protein
VEVRLLAFIGVAVILTISPGPDFALVTRVALGRGSWSAWRTSLGVATGHLCWGAAAAFGVAAIIHTSATLYTVLRLAGAAYLVWLGVHALLARSPASDSLTGASASSDSSPPNLASASTMRSRARLDPYWQGVVNDLLNPKIGVFYTTLLPQFISPGQSVVVASLILAAIFAVIVMLWLTIYVVVLARAEAFFRRSSVRRALERVTGVVLIGLGLRLALERVA